MNEYMNISHEIMTDIYNMSKGCKDYNFAMFTHNRKRLAELLEFVDDTRNSLIIYKSNQSINLILTRGKASYISEKNILFTLKFDQNMIKSKNSMNIMNDILEKLEYQIGSNDLLELERQRGFVERQNQETDEEAQEGDNNAESGYYEQFGVECDEILGEDGCNEYDKL